MIPEPDPTNRASYYYSQFGQDEFLERHVFKGLKGGFFVEAGAVNGVMDSNSLALEALHGWTGLLVEGNPMNYPTALMAQRPSYFAPTCLATKETPHFAQFTENRQVEKGMAGLVPEHLVATVTDTHQLQCLPLYSLLLAVGLPRVNLFALDIEGAEFQVLQTIPWTKVDIQVILVELEHAGKVFPGTRREVHNYLSSVGYDYVATLAVDDLFVRRDLNTPEELGLDREGRRAVGTTRDFYHLYDASLEGLPSQEEWDRRDPGTTKPTQEEEKRVEL